MKALQDINGMNEHEGQGLWNEAPNVLDEIKIYECQIIRVEDDLMSENNFPTRRPLRWWDWALKEAEILKTYGWHRHRVEAKKKGLQLEQAMETMLVLLEAISTFYNIDN